MMEMAKRYAALKASISLSRDWRTGILNAMPPASNIGAASNSMACMLCK
jgi:hypothetical protein